MCVWWVAGAGWALLSRSQLHSAAPWQITLIFVLLVVAYVLAIYSIDCMVIGAGPGVGCGLWAWVNTVIVLVFAAAIMLSMFTSKNLTPPAYTDAVRWASSRDRHSLSLQGDDGHWDDHLGFRV